MNSSSDRKHAQIVAAAQVMMSEAISKTYQNGFNTFFTGTGSGGSKPRFPGHVSQTLSDAEYRKRRAAQKKATLIAARRAGKTFPIIHSNDH